MAEDKAADAVAAAAATDDPRAAPGSGGAEGACGGDDTGHATPPGVATVKIITLTDIKVIRANGDIEQVEHSE